jgi:hypothetical protein
MAYIFFKWNKDLDLDNLKNSFAFAFLINPKNIDADDCREGYYSRKEPSKKKLNELVGFVSYHLHGGGTCWLITKTDLFKSDERLISAYGEKYLGYSSINYKKSDLTAYAEILESSSEASIFFRNYSDNETLINSKVTEYFLKVGITQEEVDAINKKNRESVSKIVSPLKKKIEAYKKTINNLKPIYIRDF